MNKMKSGEICYKGRLFQTNHHPSSSPPEKKKNINSSDDDDDDDDDNNEDNMSVICLDGEWDSNWNLIKTKEKPIIIT